MSNEGCNSLEFQLYISILYEEFSRFGGGCADVDKVGR
jgi:hypothetical protein